jgi:hypothetical protein
MANDKKAREQQALGVWAKVPDGRGSTKWPSASKAAGTSAKASTPFSTSDGKPIDPGQSADGRFDVTRQGRTQADATGGPPPASALPPNPRQTPGTPEARLGNASSIPKGGTTPPMVSPSYRIGTTKSPMKGMR